MAKLRDQAREWRPGPGLYGAGMHDFVLAETQLGWRAAAALDDEALGFGPLVDRLFAELGWR